MSAVLKKLAAGLLTDKKVLKTIGGIILGLMVIIAMPVAAVIALFSSDIELDLDDLKQQMEAEFSGEELAGFGLFSQKLNEVETAMTAAGFAEYAKAAQNLSLVFLSDRMKEDGFSDRLAGCYEKGQTNESFLSALNLAFGISISLDDLLAVAGDQTVETEAETEIAVDESVEVTINETFFHEDEE